MKTTMRVIKGDPHAMMRCNVCGSEHQPMLGHGGRISRAAYQCRYGCVAERTKDEVVDMKEIQLLNDFIKAGANLNDWIKQKDPSNIMTSLDWIEEELAVILPVVEGLLKEIECEEMNKAA